MPIDITDVARRTQLVGAGTGPYNFTFQILDDDDIAVYQDDTLLTKTTDYSVTINGDGTGSVTTVASMTGSTVTIIGARPYARLTDFSTGGDFFAANVNDELDSILILIQQLRESVNLTAKLSDTTAFSGDLVFPEPSANKLIGWNSGATALENKTAADVDLTVVSAFIATLLDDSDAAAARATLGAIGEGDFTAAGQILMAQASGDAVPVSSPLGGAQIINGKIALSVGSSALTVALKGLDGNDPSATNPVFIKIPQNSAGVFDGTYAIRKVTAALSVVVSSGSTLGHTSAVACPVYFYLIDNAGTPELAVSTKFFGTPAVVTTTAEGGAGAADSATTMYSTTARTNVSASVIGRWKSTQTTAGTWAAVTGEQQLYPFPYKAPTLQSFTSSGTYTRPWDVLSLKITAVGGGGGGGGSGTAGGAGGGSGGSAGGTAIKLLGAANCAATETVTIGAGGAGGSAGANVGSNGGATSFGTHCVAGGGLGGNFGTNNSTAQGVSGGVGTTGDILIRGGDSTGGSGVTSAYGLGGTGGSSTLGGGGLGGHSGNGGNAGGQYGGGGGGGSMTGGSSAGGAGFAGIVLVEEFYQ